MELQSVVKGIDKRQGLLTPAGAALNGLRSWYCVENLPYLLTKLNEKSLN